jgi:hypothetical protein
VRERNEKPANGAERGKGPRVFSLRVPCLRPQALEHVGQGIEITTVLDLFGDDVGAGGPLDQAAEPGRQEVVKGPLPAAHAGAHGFQLDVLRQGRTFLGELGVEGCGDIPHGVEAALFTLEEEFLGVFAHQAAEASMHGLLFGAAQLGAEDGVAAVDEFTVDVGAAGGDDPILAGISAAFILAA